VIVASIVSTILFSFAFNIDLLVGISFEWTGITGHNRTKVFLVEQLSVDLEKCDHHPLFDKHQNCLLSSSYDACQKMDDGHISPRLIFEIIEQCQVWMMVL